MNELEKELGGKLLIRYSNKLELSPLGENLLPRISGIVQDYVSMLTYIADSNKREHGEDPNCLQLECQLISMLAFFPPSVKDYVFRSHDIYFNESDNSQIRQMLLNSKKGDPENDRPVVGVMCFFDRELNSGESGIEDLSEYGFAYKPYLSTYDRVMVCSSSPLAREETITDEQLASQALVCTNSHLHSVLAKRFGHDAIMLTSPDFTVRRRMVEKGLALSFLPAIAELTMEDRSGFVLRDMENPYEVQIGFVGTAEDLESVQMQHFITAMNSFWRTHMDSGLYTLAA